MVLLLQRGGGGGRGPEPKRIIHQPLVEKVCELGRVWLGAWIQH